MTTTFPRFFAEIASSDVATIKKLYRQLAMKYHPDLCTELSRDEATEWMKEINRQYEQALKGADGAETPGDDGRVHTYRYREEQEREIIDLIDRTISRLRDPIASGDLEFWLIGSWLWIQGDTKPWRDTLGKGPDDKPGLGYSWHSKRLCWYAKPTGYRSHYSGKSLGHLAAQYGATNLADEAKNAPSGGKKAAPRKAVKGR